jgi:hypothetical protein
VGQRNIFHQAAQRRADLSIRKSFKIAGKLGAQLELNAFNVTNTMSADVPQNQAQIRQNNGCSASTISQGYNNCSTYRSYLGYGQVVTANNPTDQASALANLDQVPFATGTGKGTVLPLHLTPGPNGQTGQGTCTTSLVVAGQDYCPNNAANFGSVTSAIGGPRAFTMGFHITY